ncbi:hypothetical protein PSTG_20015, partial [Puccinia striiformis f. sp. tritici PST-78]
MQLPSTLARTALVLVSFALNARAVWPPPNDYIMDDNVDRAKGYQSVYSANGQEAFRFAKRDEFPRPGMTVSTLQDGSSKELFRVVS